MAWQFDTRWRLAQNGVDTMILVLRGVHTGAYHTVRILSWEGNSETLSRPPFPQPFSPSISVNPRLLYTAGV